MSRYGVEDGRREVAVHYGGHTPWPNRTRYGQFAPQTVSQVQLAGRTGQSDLCRGVAQGFTGRFARRLPLSSLTLGERLWNRFIDESPDSMSIV
jgi:hypothetical protein